MFIFFDETTFTFCKIILFLCKTYLMFCKDKKCSFEHVLTGEKIPQEFYLMLRVKVDKPDKVKGQLFFSLFKKKSLFILSFH